MVELYLHSFIPLHGIMLNELIKRINLPFYLYLIIGILEVPGKPSEDVHGFIQSLQ
jgi:hypothetical protein